MDAQYVVKGWSAKYIAKYLSKPADINSIPAVSLTYSENSSSQQTFKQHFENRVIGMPMLTYLLLGWHINQSSIEVIHLPSVLEPFKKGVLKNIKTLNTLSEFDEEIFHNNKAYKWLTRPSNYIDLKFEIFYQLIKVPTNPSTPYLKRNKPIITRTYYLPYIDSEKYFHQKLLFMTKSISSAITIDENFLKFTYTTFKESFLTILQYILY